MRVVMVEIGHIRTVLEVGFNGNDISDKLSKFRGGECRSIPLRREFPYEDRQFDVVLMAADVVNRDSVKEAHRVLRVNGHLLFVLPEKTKTQQGFTLPDIYSMVREGFNIIMVDKVPFWHFWVKKREFFICAEKKNWREHKNRFTPYV